MSYTFLQEQGEESSAESFSDIPASVLSRLNLTAEKSYCSVNEMESCPSSQSGTMYEPSTEIRGGGRLMSSVVDSRARIYQKRVTELELMAHALDFGEKCSESFVKFDRVSRSWKTHQCLFEEDLPELSVTLPAFGMMRNGQLLDAGALALRMTAK